MSESQQSGSSPSFGVDVFCPVCGYGLHGAPGSRCPECGHSLENLRSEECRIPWVHRRTADRLRTYWQTVWMVTFRPLRFAEEYAHDLRIEDARRFQVITVLLAWLPVVAATLVVYATVPFESEVGSPAQQIVTTGFIQPGPTLFDRAYAEVWPAMILHVCFVLFLLAATGIPAYYFQLRSLAPVQQRNGAALSTFACAPLAYYPLLILAICALARITSFDRWGLAYLLAPHRWPVFSLAGAGGACIFAWWWGLLRLMQRTMPLRKLRHAALGIGLPLVWVGLAWIFLGVVPGIVLYVLVIIVSLTG